jgi:8-oxo-dGTP pyrophosphatase MutT (NUDIX family)
MEPGETLKECATRELEEETDYRAESLKPLFDCYAAPGYSVTKKPAYSRTGGPKKDWNVRLLRRPAEISVRPRRDVSV